MDLAELFPQIYDTKPQLQMPDHIDYRYQATTSPMSEAVVNIVLLVISQLLIPGAARFIVRLWPSSRVYSIRVMLMLAWYAVMASVIVGVRGQLEQAWKMGFIGDGLRVAERRRT